MKKELQKIWNNQQKFNELVMGKKLNQLNLAEKQQWTKEYILHLHSETDELLREIAWKVHREEPTPIILSNLYEELIDSFKYWLSIALLWGFTPERMFEEYYRKSSVVEQRWKQEKKLFAKAGRKIVAVDIDGVLFRYVDSFLDFVERETGVDLVNLRKPETPNLYDHLSGILGYGRLLQLKDRYRQSGQKRNGYLLSGAREFLMNLKQKGFTIILLTARPYKKYKRLYADTIEWLKKYELPYDGIVWNERKNEVIYQEFPDLAFMVEDMSEKAESVARLGCKVYLLDRSYNQASENKNVLRVKDFAEIAERERLHEKDQ